MQQPQRAATRSGQGHAAGRRAPADIADVYPTSYYNPAYTWQGLKAHWRHAQGAGTPFPQARVMGGGGAVMGIVALRGVAADYERWHEAGASGWRWADVLPYFNKLENDADFAGDMHGHAFDTTSRLSWNCDPA